MSDPTVLPSSLPAPVDDGAARHLMGLRLPPLQLPSTDGGHLDLGALGDGRTILYVYPMTRTPGRALPHGWDEFPGARGCTCRSRSSPPSKAAPPPRSSCRHASWPGASTCGGSRWSCVNAWSSTSSTRSSRRTRTPSRLLRGSGPTDLRRLPTTRQAVTTSVVDDLLTAYQMVDTSATQAGAHRRRSARCGGRDA